MAVGSFTAMTFLTKNSFLDEIRKQYVVAARAKGLTENQVLVRTRLPQRHAARHLRLPVRVHQRLLLRRPADRNDFLARRPRPSLVRKHREARLSGRVRVSLHLLARSACSSASCRTSSTPSSIRASTSRRARSERWIRRTDNAPEATIPIATAAAKSWFAAATTALRLPPVARQSPPSRTLQVAQARLSLVPDLLGAVPDYALCRVHRQRPAADRQLQGRNSVSRFSSTIRKRSSAASSPSPTTARPTSPTRSTPTAGCCGRRSAIPIDTINKDYPGRIGENGICLGYPAPPPWASSLKLCDAPADQVARFKELGNTNWLGLDRPRPRRRCARHLRLSHFGAVRSDPDDRLVGARRPRGRGAGLLRRHDRSHFPAPARNLELDTGTVRAVDPVVAVRAGFLDAARHSADLQLDVARRSRARRISARPQSRIRPGGACPRASPTGRSCSSICCRMRWSRR